MCGVRERSRWALALATVPLWPIVWLLIFASAARVKLGHWPSYGQPDPKTLHWFPADLAVLPLLLLAPPCRVHVGDRRAISMAGWSPSLVHLLDDAGILRRVALVANVRPGWTLQLVGRLMRPAPRVHRRDTRSEACALEHLAGQPTPNRRTLRLSIPVG
jgi:hypothetical protein